MERVEESEAARDCMRLTLLQVVLNKWVWCGKAASHCKRMSVSCSAQHRAVALLIVAPLAGLAPENDARHRVR